MNHLYVNYIMLIARMQTQDPSNDPGYKSYIQATALPENKILDHHFWSVYILKLED